jgi:hypothetical protein
MSGKIYNLVTPRIDHIYRRYQKALPPEITQNMILIYDHNLMIFWNDVLKGTYISHLPYHIVNNKSESLII